MKAEERKLADILAAPCGHPVLCQRGDEREGTFYCGWCADIGIAAETMRERCIQAAETSRSHAGDCGCAACWGVANAVAAMKELKVEVQ